MSVQWGWTGASVLFQGLKSKIFFVALLTIEEKYVELWMLNKHNLGKKRSPAQAGFRCLAALTYIRYVQRRFFSPL
ncbi:hypothetical protein D6833_09790 [Candidatus Parcubacteria bacterium]|nr:MAG: hypothetical protein D6833_09790 [Candidatus Parcubacteria bacterium]